MLTLFQIINYCFVPKYDFVRIFSEKFIINILPESKTFFNNWFCNNISTKFLSSQYRTTFHIQSGFILDRTQVCYESPGYNLSHMKFRPWGYSMTYFLPIVHSFRIISFDCIVCVLFAVPDDKRYSSFSHVFLFLWD